MSIDSQQQPKQQKQQIDWRRDKVLELSVKGHNQTDISKILKIHKSTISRDIEYLRTIAKENLKHHIEDRLPFEYEQCFQGITQIIHHVWMLSEKSDNNIKEKLQSLSLAKDCYSIKMDLLTNSNLLKDVITFVEQSKEKIGIEMKKEEIEKYEKEVVIDKEKKNEDDLSRSNTSKRRTYNSIF